MTTNLQEKSKTELFNVIEFAQTEIAKYMEEKNILSLQFSEEKSQLENKIEQQNEKIARLEERINLLLQARFGSRCEKFAYPHQLSLFDEPAVALKKLLILKALRRTFKLQVIPVQKKVGAKHCLLICLAKKFIID